MVFSFLLHLGLEGFLASKPIHIIAPISATFLRQRAAQMKTSFKRLGVEYSTSAASQPLSLGDPTTKAYVDPTAVIDPPPPSSSGSTIRSMLDIIMTIQATHGQLLVDVLMEL